VSRTRALIVAALLVVFFATGGVLIYANSHKGGQTRTFNVTVTGAKSMNPSTLEPAHVGDVISINVTSDQEGEVHIHGYDLAIAVKQGQAASRTFTADKTCSCEIEWEETSQPLGTLVVSP
jgi:hypothetical protein